MRFLILFLLLSTTVYAQERISTDSPEYWCDAEWPPKEGESRTRGVDVNGDVCIKIIREAEKIVEVPADSTESIVVTLTHNKKGEPTMKASCPTTFSWYKLRAVAIENGCIEKLRTKGGNTYIIFENCDK